MRSRPSSWFESSVAAASLLLIRLGLKRETHGISISRWPRGRRRAALTLAAGVLAGSGAAATTGFLVYDASREISPDLREAIRTCAREPSCVEWRVEAKCEVTNIVGRTRLRTRVFHAYGRGPDEAIWMIAHFQRGCAAEKVDSPSEISESHRERLQ